MSEGVENLDLDFFSLPSPREKGYPEEAARCLSLFGAILIQAIRDFLAAKNPKNLGKKDVQALGTQAEIWLFYESPDNLHLLYEFSSLKEWKLAILTSFEHICSLFDLDPDYIRRRILELLKEGQYYTLGRRYG